MARRATSLASKEKVTTTTALSTERFRIPHLLSAATREA